MSDLARLVHIPVLLNESIQGLSIVPGDIVLDATLGAGGHSEAICRSTSGLTVIGLDADSDAISRSEKRLMNCTDNCRFIFEEINFRYVDRALEKHSIDHIDKALFDLGVSSFTYESGRGFSFQKDEPLRMTLSTDPNALSAYDVVNTWAEETLADIIYGFGEDKFARRIARAIVEQRESKPIETSAELEKCIYSAVPFYARHGRTHPATKTFQALRIAVNDEMNALKEGLEKTWGKLAVGGRIAVISFHSLEDRIVKQYFRSLESACSGEILTKKPIVPSDTEVSDNPRSRSSKLRVIKKIL